MSGASIARRSLLAIQISPRSTSTTWVISQDPQQESFLSLLSSPACEDSSRLITFFDSEFSLEQYAFIVVHHEGIHQGEWALYASLAGFETPPLWEDAWGL